MIIITVDFNPFSSHELFIVPAEFEFIRQFYVASIQYWQGKNVFQW